METFKPVSLFYCDNKYGQQENIQNVQMTNTQSQGE